MRRLLTRILPFLLLFCFFQPAFAQKIKEKDDVIYLGEKPMFKIFKQKQGGLFSYANYHVLSMTGDTLIRLIGSGGVMHPFEYESLAPRFDCFKVSFVGKDKSAFLEYEMGEKHVASTLIEHNLIVNGKLNPAAIDSFVTAGKSVEQKYEAFKIRIDKRKEILANKDRMAQIRGLKLVPRSYVDKIGAYNGMVAVGTVNIGSFKLESDNNYGVSYRLFYMNGKPTGSIFFEKAKKRVFIRFFIDDKSVEYFIKGDVFDKTEFYNAIQQFTDLGYL
jgi:hypothetical protein